MGGFAFGLNEVPKGTGVFAISSANWSEYRLVGSDGPSGAGGSETGVVSSCGNDAIYSASLTSYGLVPANADKLSVGFGAV